MKISEVSALTGLTIDTLRFYEKIGLIEPPARDSGGRRNYDAGILAWIRFLVKLNATGMKQSERIRYAKLRNEGPSTVPERRQMLEKQREDIQVQIRNLQETLTFLGQKIETYEQMEQELVDV